MSDKGYSHRFETSVDVDASPDVVFAELDDHEKLSAHMMKSSPMMGGGSMRFEFDQAHGRAVGSEIQLSGEIMGVSLDVREVVTEREPPRRKIWETVEAPHLLVIGDYRMGFAIEPRDSGSRLTVFIDYDDPPGTWAALGWLLGPVYARWCTVSMATGAAETLAKR